MLERPVTTVLGYVTACGNELRLVSIVEADESAEIVLETKHRDSLGEPYWLRYDSDCVDRESNALSSVLYYMLLHARKERDEWQMAAAEQESKVEALAWPNTNQPNYPFIIKNVDNGNDV